MLDVALLKIARAFVNFVHFLLGIAYDRKYYFRERLYSRIVVYIVDKTLTRRWATSHKQRHICTSLTSETAAIDRINYGVSIDTSTKDT